MVKALEPYQSIHCFAHLINNAVSKMLKDVKDFVDAVTALVKYYKVTGLNAALKVTLKSNISIRWNTVFYMLESVIQNWEGINEILTAKNEMDRLQNIDIETLNVIRNFLKIFEEATTEIEASRRPTLHIVIPWYFRLLKSLEFSVKHYVVVSQMKASGREYFVCNISNHLTSYHKIATFLCPVLKSLRMYDVNTRNEIVESTR